MNGNSELKMWGGAWAGKGEEKGSISISFGGSYELGKSTEIRLKVCIF